MREITQQPQALQVISKRISRRRKISKPFTPLPVGYLDKIPRLLQPMFLLLWTMGQGKPVTEVYRVLAARLGVTIRTAQNYAYALQKLGILRIETRKVAHRWNGANTFYFAELDGFIVDERHEENFVEILKQDLNTNTTTPREVPRGKKSYAQVRWEWNQARRKQHSQPHVGRCRMRHVEALRISAGACVGTWDDEIKRLLREQEERYAEWDRELRERGGVR